MRDVEVVSPLEPGETTQRIVRLETKLGRPLTAVAVRLDPDRYFPTLTVELANPRVAGALDDWRIAHYRALGFIDWLYVFSPQAVQSSSATRDAPEREFDLATIDFDRVPAIAAAAIARVALQEDARVSAMELARPLDRAGPPQWQVKVQSAHETAEAYLDPAGRLTGADLDQTLRVLNAPRLVDLFAGGPPLLDAAAAIGQHFAGKERIERGDVRRAEIYLELAAGQPGEAPGTPYVSDAKGVRRVGSPEPPPIQVLAQWTPKYQPFASGEIDWAALPRLVAVARDKLGAPEAKIQTVELRKRAACLAPPMIEWKVVSGPGASVVLDGAGRVLRVMAQPAANHFDTARLAGFMADLRCAAGAHAALIQLDLGLGAALRDPRQPERILELAYVDDWFGVRPAVGGLPGRWQGKPYGEDRFFDLAEVDDKLVAALPALESAALKALAVADGKVSHVTIERGPAPAAAGGALQIRVFVIGSGAAGSIAFDPGGHVMR